eukprot:gene7904-1116_t
MAIQEDSENPFVPMHGGKKRMGRSSFGQQTLSAKTTAPNFSYGHSTRETRGKEFLSADHMKVENRCREGPGHIYHLPSSIDKQPSAQKPNAPLFSFGKNERMKFAFSAASGLMGPMYGLVMAAPRSSVDEDDWVPGPGMYKKTSAFGSQAMSSKTSFPNYRFGTSDRDQADKVYLSNAHVRGNKGMAGADPGTYNPPEAFGSQALSGKRNGPSFSQGKVDRLKNDYEKMSASLPPVGRYETWGTFGKMALSTAQTMPAASFGKASRSGEENRFLSPNHAVKTNMGTFSPGNYDHQNESSLSSVGRQGLSQRSNSPMTKFSRAPKRVFQTANTPGPGAYD